MGYASHQLGAPLAEFHAPLAEFHDYGTFDGFGAKKKKKKKPSRFKRILKKVGKVALKAAPIVAGLTLGPVGGIAVGAAAGAVGRGKPKLKRILRSAAYGGAAGLVRTGQAGRILVKGGKIAAKLAKRGGRIVSKIPKEVIGGGVIGAGGGAVVDLIQKRRKRQMPDEPLTPEESPIDSGGPVIDVSTPQQECFANGGIWTRSGCVFPPTPQGTLPTNGGVDAEGPLPQAAPPPGTEPASPVDTPTSGQLPVAGGTIPGPATGAIMPGSGGEQFRPSAEEEALPEEEAKKPNVAILLAAGVAVLILLNKKKGR